MIAYIAVDENQHAHWVGTQAEAKAIDKTFTQFDIPTDKAGLIAFINEKQDELNVLRDELSTPVPGDDLGPRDRCKSCDTILTSYEGADLCRSCEPAAPTTNYAQASIDLDDCFENLSLARQLHFAGVALENARERL